VQVTFVIPHDSGLRRGGVHMQVEMTRKALQENGIQVKILTPMTKQVGDIVHFFGTFNYYWHTALFCQVEGIPYVTSPIYLEPRSGWKLTAYRLWLKLKRRYPNQESKLLKSSRLLFTLSASEEEKIRRLFGIRPERFRRVPNGVEERFAQANPKLFRERYGIREPFVLHVGFVEPRKNQLGLIRALKGLGIKMVFIGKATNAKYLQRCQSEAGDQAVFLGEIPHESELLPSAYAAAKVFCLPSFSEVLSIAALEAATAGTRLVLSTPWQPQEHFGKFAFYVNPHSIAEIRQMVLKAWETPNDVDEQRRYFLKHYSWQKVAELLIAGYQEVTST